MACLVGCDFWDLFAALAALELVGYSDLTPEEVLVILAALRY